MHKYLVDIHLIIFEARVSIHENMGKQHRQLWYMYQKTHVYIRTYITTSKNCFNSGRGGGFIIRNHGYRCKISDRVNSTTF